MTLSAFYLLIAVISLYCTCCAIFRFRRFGWYIVVHFFLGWLCGELALIHIIWQVTLTGLLAALGALSHPLAQAGLAIFSLSWLGLVHLHLQAMETPKHLHHALSLALGNNYRTSIPAGRQHLLAGHTASTHWLRPFSFTREGIRKHENIAYSDKGKRNLLDIYQPIEAREGGYPVLLQIHGGGWMVGNKQQQGIPLIYHMATSGWICVDINYRLSPDAAFPAHIIDVKKAIAWIREYIPEYGGSPEFIAITGGSAGGHLSSLAALTPDKLEWQPGFEHADTRVQAAVPLYGAYDLMDRSDIRRDMSMEDVVARQILQCRPDDNPELWNAASPINQVRPDAPPMFVIHGTHDSILWPEEARRFVAALKSRSSQPVVYGELPGAQHGFEIFHSVRTSHTVQAVAYFLEWAHANRITVKRD